MQQDDLMTKVLSKLDNLTIEVKALRNDTSTTRSDVKMLGLSLDVAETINKAMQTDLNDIKTDVGELKSDVGELKFSVRRLEVLHEETAEDIKHILEIVTPSAKETIKLRKHVEKQDETILFHENRIGFLENKVA